MDLRRRLAPLTALCLTAALSSAMTAPAHADVLGSSETIVSGTTTPAGVGESSAAALPDGRFLTVWEAARQVTTGTTQGVKREIFGRLSSSEGVPLGTPVLLVSAGGADDATQDAADPVLATLPSGQVALAYAVDVLADTDASATPVDRTNWQIRAAVLDPTALGPVASVAITQVETEDPTYDQQHPDLAVDHGRLRLVWDGDTPATGEGQSHVWTTSVPLDLSGTPSIVRVSPATPADAAYDHTRPRVAAVTAGSGSDAAIVWESVASLDGTNLPVRRLRLARVIDATVTAGPVIGTASIDQSVEELAPDLAASTTGYRVVWSSNVSGAYRIHAAGLDASLTVTNVQAAITDNQDTWPSVATDPTQPGQFVVTFAHRTSVAGGGHYEVLSGRFDASGSGVEPLAQVSTVDANMSQLNAESLRPATVVRPDGAALHAWSRVRVDSGAGVATRISATRADLTTALTVSPARPSPARPGINPASVVTVALTYGNAATSSVAAPTEVTLDFPGFIIGSASATGPAVATATPGVFTTTALAPGAGGTITFTGTMDAAAEGTPRVAKATITAVGVVVEDPQTNNTAAASVTIDYPPAYQAMTRLDSDPTSSASVRWQVTFDQPVTGVDASDFSIATTGGLVPGTPTVTCVGAVCTLTLTPSGDSGTVALRLLDTATISDGTGHPIATGNLPVTGPAYVVDRVAPSVAVTALGPDPTNAALIGFRLDFSEPVTAPVAAKMTVSGGMVDSIARTDAGSGPVSAWTVRVAPSGDGQVSLTPQAGAASDPAGNLSTAGTTESRTSDRTAPVLSLAGPSGPQRSDYDVTITASETVTALSVASVSVSGGSVTSFTGSGPWTARIQPISEGPVVLTVAAAAVFDAAGNGNALRTLATVYDVTRPQVTVTSAAGDPTGDSPIDFTLTFNEPVTGLTLADVAVTGGTAALSGSGAVRTVRVTPSADGSVSVAVPADVAIDAAGNTNTAGAVVTRVYDTTGPTPQLSADVTSPTHSTSFTVTVSWSEDVTGFTLSDLTVTNAILSDLAGSNRAWTVLVTPDSEGPLTLSVPAGAVEDLIGNLSLAATPLTIRVDRTSPTVSVTGPSGPTNAASSTVQLTFSEPVTGLTLSDLVADNATLSGLAGSGADYTVTATPTAEGQATVRLPAGSARDAATNPNAVSNTLAWTYDVTATADLTYAGPAWVNAPIALSLTLSDDAPLVPSNFETDNGTVTSVAGGPRIYDVVFAPTAQGTARVRLPAGAFTDAAGNVSTTSGWVEVDHDNVRPTVNSLDVPAWPTEPFTVSVEFSEPVTGLAAGSIAVTNGQVSDVAGAGRSWTFLLTPTADGTVTVALADGSTRDLTGNDSVAFGPVSTTYDTTPPTVALSSPTPAVVTTSPIAVEVLFSEPVTGLDLSGLSVTNGTATHLVGGGNRWTLDLVPTAEGTITLEVKAGAAQDQSGQSSVASAVFSREFDSTRPTLALTTTVAPVSDSSSIPVTARFAKAVLGFDVTDLQPTNASVSAFSRVDDRTWTFTLTPDADGLVGVEVPERAAATAGGNLAFGGSLSVTVDRTAPVISLTAPRSPTAEGPVTFGLTLSEPAAGLDEADVSVSGSAAPAAVALLPVSDRTWQVVVSGMTRDGNVVVSVRADAVRDGAGNVSQGADATARWRANTASLRSIALLAKPGLRSRNRVVLPLRVRGSGDVVFTATSSHPRLLPASAISVTGSGSQRQLTLAARAHRSGRSRVVVTARVGDTTRTLRLTLIIGGGGHDRLVGTRGIDVILGRGGADMLLGRGGSDHLYGGFGADRVIGGAGDDVLVAGPGRDRLIGGRGADVFVAWPHDRLVDMRRGQGDRVQRPSRTARDLMSD